MYESPGDVQACDSCVLFPGAPAEPECGFCLTNSDKVMDMGSLGRKEPRHYLTRCVTSLMPPANPSISRQQTLSHPVTEVLKNKSL